jgi:transketolase
VRTLVELAAQDPRIALLTGDLGFMAIEPFIEQFPDRFYNVGVAEQNLVGIATGLAEAGYLPFVYSIAPFATLRPYEFIRNGPVLHHLPVRIVGIGGGFEYATAGPTHFALEDIAVMRALPGLAVIAPADYQQAATALRQTWDFPGPVYFRVGKDDKTIVPGLHGEFSLGATQHVRAGADLLFLATGSIASEVVAAAELLADHGIDAAVHVVASIVPSPAAELAGLLPRYPLVLTVETHTREGGLGSLVAEVIAEHRTGTRLIRCGVSPGANGRLGSTEYMHRVHGLDRESLAKRVLAAFAECGA